MVIAHRFSAPTFGSYSRPILTVNGRATGVGDEVIEQGLGQRMTE